jgi:hypothetical protein
MNKIDFYAQEPHHIKHASSIYDALPLIIKGNFCKNVSEIRSDYVAVFSYKSLKDVNNFRKKVIFGEHGVGLSYNIEHPSYVGSNVGRERVILRLVPNQLARKREKKILKCPIEVIGVPYMDQFKDLKVKGKFKGDKPTVAFAFHWDATAAPETRSAATYFLPHLAELKKHYNVIGHAHPRIMSRMYMIYGRNGVGAAGDFEDVMKEADVLCVDNSSIMYQFGWLNKPIVLLNDPRYRKDVEHEGNPRFWRHADMAPNVNHPSELKDAIDDALAGKYQKRLRECVKEIIPFTDPKKAVKAIRVCLKKN